MDKYIEDYKEYLKAKKLSTNTVSSYIYDINSFQDYLSSQYKTELISARKAQILTYLVSLQKSGKSSSTISRTISSLKSFFSYMKRERLIDESPALSLHSPKQIKKAPAALTVEEITILMNMPDKNKFKGARDSAILELLYSSGIKVTELISICMKDLNLDAAMILIDGPKERIVPLGGAAHDAIENYVTLFRDIKCQDGNNRLFVNITGEPVSRQGIWKILKYYEKKMGLDKELSPQVLRNSFAVHMLTNGADIRTVQEILGHQSLAATQNYLQNIEFKSLEVFKKAFPRA